jgi:hypothetical protein
MTKRSVMELRKRAQACRPVAALIAALEGMYGAR